VAALDPFRYEIDLGEGLGDSHGAMIQLIGKKKRVLEIGCAAGAMTRQLVNRECSVVGVEIEAVAAAQARQFAERVLVTDVEALDFGEEFGEEQFDAVVFGDVLEHLRDPAAVLSRSRAVLSDTGYVVMSIPNVAHGDLRLALLRGEFRYRPIGLLDSTHLRFFTRASVEELLRNGGVVPLSIERLEKPLFTTELELKREDFDPDLVAQIQVEPEALTYQFIIKAVPDTADGILRSLYDRADYYRTEIAALSRRLAESDELLGEIQRESDLLRVEAAALRNERRDLQLECGEYQAEITSLRSTKLFRWSAPFRRIIRSTGLFGRN
jgi:O-antigen biosynthesis protein